jgi:hypothetical protein
MSLLCTLTRAAFAVVALMASFTAAAQSLESAVMPGPVMHGHADLESACEKCHVRFDRTAQIRLCLDCHKPVAADVRAGTGYHGRLKERECRSCHTEHRGRMAKIIQLDEAKFDHALTDFPLRDKHRGRTCASCHRAKAKYSQAPADCVSCHRKDDYNKGHKNGLGPKCGNCHNENGWKEARFDHAKTRFPLRLGHADARVKCADCHSDNKFVDTPRECASCHRKDDMKDGHKGHFGPRCDSCHNEGDWKQSTFRHDRDTHFALLDRHRSARCDSCHRAPLYKEKTPTRCVACHRGDDNEKGHRGSLGDKCDKCHNASGWKGTRFEHDRDTKFPLRNKHKTTRCDSCHKDAGMREKLPVKCAACHQRDDNEKGHKGNYGDKCETCHNEKSFKPAVFEHGRDTAFPLAGKHVAARCDACHRGPLYRTKTESRCYACHEKEDVHFGSFDLQCDKCHVADDWRTLKQAQDAQPVGVTAPLTHKGRAP